MSNELTPEKLDDCMRMLNDSTEAFYKSLVGTPCYVDRNAPAGTAQIIVRCSPDVYEKLKELGQQQ